MAELYFKVKSDWEEVVKLRTEVMRLENQLNQFNGKAPLEVLDKMCSELTTAKTRLTELVNAAAVEGSKLDGAFKKGITIDMSTPTGQLKAFDDELIKMCANLNAYFDTLKGKLQDLVSVLGSGNTIADNIKVNDDNIAKIEELKRQNAELMELVKKRQEELEKEREIYNQLANAVRTNNTSAIDMMTNKATESASQIKAKIKEANAEVAKQNVIVEEISEAYEKQQAKVDKLEAKLANLKSFYGESRQSYNGQAQIIDAEENLRKAHQELITIKTDLITAKDEQKQLNDMVAEYEHQLEDAGNKAIRMRTQIMNAREAMMQLIAAGMTGTPEFHKITEEAGAMRRQMQLANATMEYFANPSRHLEGLKSALQGVAGSASLVTGIMGVFNTNSEKMAAIQTKIQSYLGIIIGLETAYATVKKTSNAMLLISEVQTLALAKAKTYETIATEAGTIATMKAAAAQAFFNTVAKMNPYLLLVSGIGLLCGAIWGLTKVLKSESEEEKRLQKEREARIKEAREAHERWANDVASSAGKQIASYENLRRKWKELGNDMTAKKKFIDDNKDAFHDLGWAVNNVADAENLFTKNTQAVINAMLARAKAAAYQTAIADEYTKSIKKRDQIDNTVAGGGYRKVYKEGDRLTNDQIKALNQQYGINLSATSLNPKTQIKGVSFSTDSKLTAASAAYLTSLEAKDATKRWKDNVEALNKETEERVGYLTKGLEQAVKMQEQAVKAVGVQEWQGGNAGSGNRTKGNSPDEILKRQIEQEQEAERTRIQNQLLQQQAVIDQMDDGAEKELAQMRLNHKKRMTELDNEEREVLNKKIEAASNDKKGNPIKGFYTSGQYRNVQLTDEDMLGVNSKRISESEKYFDNLISVFKKIESSADAPMRKMELLESAYKEVAIAASDMGDGDAAKKFVEEAERQYREGLQNINQQRLESLYDYLREFGTVQQQMFALEQSYNKKIAEEKDPSKKAMLERQKQSQLSSVNAQNLAMGIDWSTAFEGVGNVLSDVAKETLKKVEEYMQTAEFKKLDAKDKKSYTDLRSELRKETGGNSTSAFNFGIWGEISKNVKDYQDSIKKLKAAQEAHNAAVQDLRDAERDMETALKSGSKKQIEAAQAVLDAANDAVNVTSDEQTDAEDKSEAAKKKLADNTEKAANGIQNFANYVNEMANGSLYGFANGISKLVTSLAKGSDGVGKSLSELGGKIGGIIGAILQIIDALGDDPAQFINDLLDKVAKVVEKILSDLPNLIANIVEGVGNIVGGVVSGVGKLFGFDMSGIFGGGTENFDAAVERWGYLLDTWKENLEYEKSLMKEAYGSKVTEIQNKTVDYLRQSQQAAAATYRAWASDGAGWFSHSNGYEANRDAKWSYLWQYDQELAKQMGASEQEFFNQFKYIATGDIGRLFDLSVEQLKELKYNNSQFWQSLSEEARKYLEQIIELEDEIEQLELEAREQLTATSFDAIVSDFEQALAKMDSTAEDFAGNFEKYMQNAVINSLMLAKYKKQLEEWYASFAAAMDSGDELTKEEQQALKDDYDRIVQAAIAERDNLRDTFGWETDAAKQEADKKGFAAMSQDTGEELNGRFTALQIAGENISEQTNAIVPVLTDIGVSTSRTAEMVEGIGRVADDMLTNIVECYSELNMIRTTTDEMLPIMKENKKTLEKIEKNTKNI